MSIIIVAITFNCMTVFIHSPEQGQDGKYSKFYCIKFPVHATNISQEALLGQP